MDSLREYIYEQVSTQNLTKDKAKKLLIALKQKDEVQSEGIAVIGMSCRFAGANSTLEFWDNLINARCTIGNLPDERINLIQDSKVWQSRYGKDNISPGGYLNHIDLFDPEFFCISPREADRMHPGQRIILEITHEALEDGGYVEDKIKNTKTGVFIGVDSTFNSQYMELYNDNDILSLTGSVSGILSGRVAYVFDLNGPNMVIDTACSSSASAVHTALNSLKNGECDMALAGGISIFIFPDKESQKTELESSNGILKAFDRGATGTVWGEGAGIVLLKPLKKAMEDGDNIYAIIKGSAINSDGATNGITAPNADAQTEVIERAWKNAGINPETISYIETHGTGTLIGDPIEIKGISNAFKKYTNKKQFCGIGSVKCNIGHTVGASGIASLIKVVLSMKHKELPPSINFERPNNYIDFCDTPVFINDRHRKWNSNDLPRRAGVSSFGLSGTNCHIILEEAATYKPISNISKEQHLLCISAKNKNSLLKLTEKYIDFLNLNTETNETNLCYTANTGRGHYKYRTVILFNNIFDLEMKLKSITSCEKLELISSDNIFYSEINIVQDITYITSPIDIARNEVNRITKLINSKLIDLPLDRQLYGNLLKEVIFSYLRGANIDWRLLYKNSTCTKISIPLYSFDNKSYWNKSSKAMDINLMKMGLPGTNPLIDKCLSNSVFEIVYSTLFEVEKYWVLSEHLISGKSVLPGTTYIEMARCAIENSFSKPVVEINDLVFLTPLVFDTNVPIEVHTVIKKHKSVVQFTIASKSQIDDDWITHAQGNVVIKDNLQEIRIDVDEIRRTLTRKSDGDDTQGVGRFNLGPRWRNIGETLLREGEALAELCLSEEFNFDLLEYKLHPALLDNAVNVLVTNNLEEFYLPFSYGSIKIHSNLPGKFYSHVKLSKKKFVSNDIVSFDINLVHESGNVILEIHDYCVKRVLNPGMKISDPLNSGMFHQIGWNHNELTREVAKINNKRIVLFSGRSELSRKLKERLCQLNNSIIEVTRGENYRQIDEGRFLISRDIKDYYKLFDVLKEKNINYIIHMFTTDEGDDYSTNVFDDGIEWGVYSLFYLSKAVVQCRINKNVGVLLVSKYSSSITQMEKSIYPSNAAFLALGSSLELEHPNLACRGIDIDEKTTVDKIVDEINNPMEPYLVAFRNNKRYTRVIKEAPITTLSKNQMKLRHNGVYIITGGTGGIGLEIGKYLASLEQVKLILINRSSMPERNTWIDILNKNQDILLCKKIKAIQEMEQSGSSVELYNIDVSNKSEMIKMLTEVREIIGNIHGIVHCAGVAGDGFLMRKVEDNFTEVLSPKTNGTRILDELTAEDDLDFFVMFSSIAAFLAEKGQGDYAAANAFLDSYALYRSMAGRKTLCINWPAWKETGMAVNYGVNIDGEIFRAIDNKTAIHSLETALGYSMTNVIISKINNTGSFNEKGQIPIDKVSVVEKRSNRIEDQSLKSKDEAEVILIGRTNGRYTEHELIIGNVWAKILGFGKLSIYSPFQSLGGDSIHSMHMYKLLEQRFPGVLDITDIFAYPTISKLAEFVDKKLGDTPTEKTSIDKLLDQIQVGEMPIN